MLTNANIIGDKNVVFSSNMPKTDWLLSNHDWNHHENVE